jgi:hypothetical protein
MIKIPNGINPTEFKKNIGLKGSRLNPIQDADGNWVISEEEWNAPEFQYLKVKYAQFISLFTVIPFKPVATNLPPY